MLTQMELSTVLLHAAKYVIILLSLKKKFTYIMLLSGNAGISCSKDEYLSLDVYVTLVLGVVRNNAQSHFSPFKWSD